MPSRDYGAARTEDSGSVTFTVAGAGFSVPLPLPALPVFDFFDLDQDRPYELFKGAWKFLRECMPAEEATRLEAALRESRADMTTVFRIAQGVIDDATGRPTLERSDSETSPSDSGPSSNPDADATESIPSEPALASASTL